MDKIKTLTFEEVLDLHDNILKDSGGLAGLSLNKSLEAALNRAATHSFYTGINDLFEIAAIYCISIAQGHVFNDGNKRTAFSLLYNILEVNGYELEAGSEEIVNIMLEIAEKKMHKNDLIKWLKSHCVKLIQVPT